MNTTKSDKVIYVVDSVFTNKGDDGHPGRRNQLAEMFRLLLDDTVQVVDVSPDETMSSDVDVVAIFVHLTDVIEKNYTGLCNVLARLEVPIVAYSGGGKSLEKSTKEALTTKGILNLQQWFFVQHKLDGRNDHNDSEWDSLIHWLLDPNRSTEEDSLPAIIASPKVLEFGLALCILCQGFLAHYALRHPNGDGGVDTKGNSEIAMSLYKMGWVTDANAEIICNEVKTLELAAPDEEPTIDFWIGPFEGGDKSLREGIRGELPKTQESLPSHVEALIQSIERQEIPDAVVVAKAFDQLSQLLEKVAC